MALWTRVRLPPNPSIINSIPVSRKVSGFIFSSIMSGIEIDMYRCKER
jgi:hypothetical protein